MLKSYESEVTNVFSQVPSTRDWAKHTMVSYNAHVGDFKAWEYRFYGPQGYGPSALFTLEDAWEDLIEFYRKCACHARKVGDNCAKYSKVAMDLDSGVVAQLPSVNMIDK